ncbi:hypothetical protein D3C78_823980 [compost metagenome]
MQVHRTAVCLFGQCRVHQAEQPLVALATQTFADVVQAAQQALGKLCKALIAMHGDKLGAQVHHIITQDALYPPLHTVFQPDHRKTLHALIQRQRQGATAHHAAFILEHKLLDTPGALFQYINCQAVLEVDIGGLPARPLAKTGTTVIGMPFQVQAIVQAREDIGLAGTGHATEQDEIALADSLVERIQQEGTHCLVATADPRVFDARFVLEPLLDDLRAQASAKAIQITLGMGPREIGPGLDPLGLDCPRDQLVPQDNGRLLALLLVTSADALTFVVGHQRQVDHPGKRALGEFDRRTGVHHGSIVEKDVAVIGDIDGHQITSTALLCRSTSSPIGARSNPSSAATAKNCSLPSGVTATSKPPLVCGSHSTRLCNSWTRPSLLA